MLQKQLYLDETPALSMDLYLNALNFITGCYIIQVSDKEAKLLLYDSLSLLLVKQNYNIERYKLITIVKFPKQYYHMLNM